jgi:uncharacterized protein with PIN domain
MVIDTSAIVAILRNEPQAAKLERALVASPVRLVPAACVLDGWRRWFHNNLAEFVPSPAVPAHLQDLSNRARAYVEAASLANTRRAYAAN